MLGGLTPAVWDGLAGRNFYSSAAWLAFCAADFGGESAAAVVRRGDEPACAIPFVEVHDPSVLLSLYRWHDVLAEYGLPAPPPAGLLVGPREGYQTHVLSGPDGPATADVEELVGRIREAHADAVAMYVTTAGASAFRDAGVETVPVALEADAWIEVPEGGWEPWLESLPKKRRYSVRQEVRRFGEAGYRVDQVGLPECWSQLGDMASATQAKYGEASDPEPLLRALENHARCMGDDARVALCRTGDGDPVGFCLYYVWADTVFIRWAGFDYERLADAAEYFNLVYYAQLELASARGWRWLHAGLKSTEAKALRGAELRPVWLVDLAEDSVLAGAASEVRSHNRRCYERLKADPRTADAVVDDAWEPFL
jgi:hypothetical protein